MSRNGVASLRDYRGHALPTHPEPSEPLPTGNSQADRTARRAAYRRSFVLSAAGEDYLARRPSGLSNQS